MLVSVLAAFLIVSRGGPIDGAAQLESAFGVRTIGADYAVVEALKMPSGARLVVFEDKAAPAEAERAAAPAAEEKPAGEANAPEEKVDWGRVTIPPAQARPRRVTFLFLEENASHEILESFFRNVERRSLTDLGPEGGKVVVASGKLGWRGFDADWIHERGFERGGTFRDGMRVDLSVEKRSCVMTAEWSRGEPASPAALDQLLDALGSK
jgi:hypothetical protein